MTTFISTPRALPSKPSDRLEHTSTLGDQRESHVHESIDGECDYVNCNINEELVPALKLKQLGLWIRTERLKHSCCYHTG
jgi:hypothetical protein